MINKIREALHNKIRGSELAASNTEIVCRCPFCGSTSSYNKKHLYISVSAKKPVMYNCFKCNNSGIVDQSFLKLLNITDISLIQSIASYNNRMIINNNHVVTTNRYYNGTNNYFHRYINSFNSSTNISSQIKEQKLSYLNSRLGVNFTEIDYIHLKIILDLSLFYYAIRKVVKANESDMNIIMNEYIGFVSVDNSYISLRHIKNDDKFRWIIIKLVNNNDLILHKAYGIPTILDNNTNTIHICEGQFDILSVYLNLVKNKNGIFVAASGSNYKTILEYLKQRFHLFHPNIELYFDNDDAGKSNMKFMSYYLTKFRQIYSGSIRFHYNALSKDFGVTKDKIKDIVEQI